MKINVAVSELDAGAAVQQAVDANAAMARAPDDPTDRKPPAISNAAAAVTKQFDLRSILERLEGFMGLANLAAEVCVFRSAILDDGTDREALSSRSIQLSNSHGESYQWHIQ